MRKCTIQGDFQIVADSLIGSQNLRDLIGSCGHYNSTVFKNTLGDIFNFNLKWCFLFPIFPMALLLVLCLYFVYIHQRVMVPQHTVLTVSKIDFKPL